MRCRIQAFIPLLVLLALLAACGQGTNVPATATPAPPMATDTPAPTATATARPIPTATAVDPTQTLPTDTPIPATPTPIPPTNTPQPTNTPVPPLDGRGGGIIAFVSSRIGYYEIYAMNADGSGQRRLSHLEDRAAYPDWSPDGSKIAFHVHHDSENWSIYALNADGSNPQQLLAGGHNAAPVWSPDGTQILFFRNQDIWVMDADGSNMQRLISGPTEDCCADWSATGGGSGRIAFETDRDGNSEIYVAAADGTNLERLTQNQAYDGWPAWSPDGSQIAFISDRDGDMEIYVMDSDGSNLRQLTDNESDDRHPDWSPGSGGLARITFDSNRDGLPGIYVMNVDGTNVQRLTNNRSDNVSPVWRPVIEPAADQAYQPVFEPSSCRFDVPAGYEIECGDLVVLEDHSQPDGPTIRLPVAIFESTGPNPAPDPVVHLVGGPGDSLLDAAAPYLEMGGDEFLKTRDYIMFNQRGSQYGTPFLTCPGVTDLYRGLAEQPLDFEERKRREVEFWLNCHDQLVEQGVTLDAYNSFEMAADVEDLRLALGYDQVNVYGVSYGSRLALTAMRDHPQGIRSVILDAVVPLQVNPTEEFAPNVYGAFQNLFHDCAADPFCSRTYPDLETTLLQTVEVLNAEPRSLRIDGQVRVLDGYDFLDILRRFISSTGAIGWLPKVITDAGEGVFELGNWGVPDIPNYADGMHWSAWCRDEMTFESEEEALALAAEIPPLFRETFAASVRFPVCEGWDSGMAAPEENQPVASDIPTLVFGGRYDPVTPPRYARLAAETLPNSFYYEFRYVAHAVMRSDRCALQIGLAFLDDPYTEPDASCIDDAHPPDFR
ncbi:MAG: alpha/beta fold hydrolase [Anaerolineae bacterium]|jgi:Tol biopolymer transport system component/pimeloyl-ACP methyl ester carboxylesterase